MALQVDSNLFSNFLLPGCIIRMSESWLAMGKKCRILALHVVRISLALWAMFKAVQVSFLVTSRQVDPGMDEF